ncbi:MAG TPA: heme-binding protein [Kofleriaceae bacterium]|nr:heme-binding protein [Kofleriaceae bacterium]
MQTDQLASQKSGDAQSPVIVTVPQAHRIARTISFGAISLGSAVGLGAGVAVLMGSRRAGIITGGLTAVAALAFRWQLQRLFTDEPAYEIERRIGDLEIRRYEPRVEAHVRVTAVDFEDALFTGFRQLFRFIDGGNSRGEKLQMTTPVISHPRAMTHTIAFVMPAGRSLASLPASEDIELVEQPVRRIAVLRYRGSYTNENFQEAQAELRDLVADAGLEGAGEPVFAGFDPPTTLPVLRRSEVWIELG